MLANSPETLTQAGTLNREVHVKATFLHELIDFVAAQLPHWRDDADRPTATAEDTLTEYLCDYLDDVARRSDGWDILHFRNEATDEANKDRKIDVAAKPRGAIIFIEGRRHSYYDPLLPIECKRLPTPKGKKRDEREYVFNQYASTGGIQRFKAGHHAARHSLGAMIGYIQQKSATFWDERVAKWITDLVNDGEPGWSTKDLLNLESDTGIVASLRSSHTRNNNLPDIELRHLWVKMN